jgi:hypothetical protein
MPDEHRNPHPSFIHPFHPSGLSLLTNRGGQSGLCWSALFLPFSQLRYNATLEPIESAWGSTFNYTQLSSNTAPSTPLHHQPIRHYTTFENSGISATAKGFFFAVPSGQISMQNLVCRLHSLGYRDQVLCPKPLHGPDTIINFSIMLPNGSVWVTEPRNPTDFLFHPFEGWHIGSVLIVVWDWEEPPGTLNC